MKRLLMVSAALAVFALLPASPANATISKYCGVNAHNWQVGAGNGQDRYEATTCRFARATARRAFSKQQRLGALPRRFRMTVGKHRLKCRVKDVPYASRLRCHDEERFVLMAYGR